ncbi:TonB-dependent receptor [Croceicoccus gelatinilyticus]|uniref:TonB-dependent receptor n=1 Tax=Croceicoccus gelatinilyticus TaxID=2835536 RepID=UPI001BD14437|nr:TonB-dependent receptor [Croceicoccus gelatinilyticus]MBS7670096.1 TonB-dependent receptor [Croceicoccus gelatinilyticus]
MKLENSKGSVRAAKGLFLSTSLIWAMPALAQDAGDEEAKSLDTNAIVVTAQRRAQRLEEVPLAITAQTGAQLSEAGVDDIRDLGNVVPGLTFTTQGAFAAPTIRGVQSTVAIAGADSPVAIYVDGVYQPNQLANVFELADIERLEVLKGPQGTLFGRNATAGAVVIHTKKPSFTTTGSIEVSEGLFFGGSAKTSTDTTVKGFVSAPLVPDVVAASLSGFYEYIDGYLTDDRTGNRTGRVDKWNLGLKFLIQPADNLEFLVSGSMSDRTDFAAMATQPLDGNSNSQFYPDAVVPTEPWHVATELERGGNPTRTKHKALSLKGTLDLDDVGTLTSITAWQDIKARITVDIDAAYSPQCTAVFACILYDEDYPEETFQQELSFASEQFGAFSFVAGAFYYRDSHFMGNGIQPLLRADGSVDPSETYAVEFDSTIKTRAWAAFGEVNLDVSDSLHLIGGLRYSREKRFGIGDAVPYFPTTGAVISDSWTPRLSVRYDVTPDWNVYATYSKGFKSAVLDTTGQSNNFAAPETITSYEIGAKGNFDVFSFSLAAFYYDYTDLQVQFFDGSATILANAADATIYGLDGEFTVDLSDDFSLRAVGSWLPEAKYDTFENGVAFALPNTPGGMSQVVLDASGERLLKAAKFAGSLALSYEGTLGSGEMDGNLTVAHSSSYAFDLLGRVKTGPYTTVNAQLGYRPGGGPLRLAVYGKNITNEAYFTSALLGNQADAPVYAPPRQMGVRLQYDF